MSLKSHLIIITTLIVFMFFGWQVMKIMAERRAAQPVVEESPRKIDVVRASWGLDCIGSQFRTRKATTQAAGDFVKGDEQVGLTENNILKQITDLCENKVSCTVKNHIEFYGFDPAPGCQYKTVVVEYRCYEFDRLWRLIVPYDQKGAIDCTREAQDQYVPEKLKPKPGQKGAADPKAVDPKAPATQPQAPAQGR
jgi:hypothetical protein